MKNKEIFNDNDKRIIKEIMNIMVPENQEIEAAGDKGLFNEMEKKSDNLLGWVGQNKNIFDDVIDCKRILREIIILRILNHPNLCQILEI